jgi:hypothetical protein
MSTKNETVRCPGCNRKQAKTAAGQYWCSACRCLFDDDPDEGLPEVYNDPVKSLEAKERREGRRRR